MLDLTNKKFNRLVGIRPTSKRKDNKIIWLFLCDCGKYKEFIGREVKSGHVKSCGCLNLERTTAMGSSNKTHGHSSSNKRSKIYVAWASMKGRCQNPTHKFYKDYGDRGITVCDRWLNKKNGFKNFLKDMGECPKGYQIDRIDNNKGYYKSNCRWTTSKINNRNRRNNHLLVMDGIEKCISEWAELTGIKKVTIRRRIKAGWSVEKTLTTPIAEKYNWRQK